ncbi:MAG: monoheme cytochrome C [Bacteroidota bacterium]
MEEDFQKQIKLLGRLLMTFVLLLAFIIGGVLYLKNNPDVLKSTESHETFPTTETIVVELNAEIIAQSGFINDPGVAQVIQNCTQCHSAKLVTQNRMSKEGWEATITWMQETQNLWDLGANQEKIVSYLAKNYGPQRKGRRQNLTDVEWYELK